MSDKILYILWGVLYILCAALGFIEEPETAASTAMTFLSMGFFIPGFVLLHRGRHKSVTVISAVSLGLTLLGLVLNIWSVAMTEAEGYLCYAFLGLVSAPMYCSRVWLLSLFLWACLLISGIAGWRKSKKRPS